MTKDRRVLTMPRFSNSQRKLAGAHYTPALLAAFVADKIARSEIATFPRVLDPSSGDGELLAAMLARLGGHAHVTGFDTDPVAVEIASERLRSEFPGTESTIVTQDFLSIALEHRDNGLFAPSEKFDLVIANPPYVRTQVMGAAESQRLSKQFELAGRVDLYYAFIEGISAVLRPGGIAGVIVSNRFMTTKSGSGVRRTILDQFDLLHVWDLGDTKLFEAAVLPAVLLLRKKDGRSTHAPRFSSIYTTNNVAIHESDDPLQALGKSETVRVNGTNFQVLHGTLDHGSDQVGVWRIATESTDAWLTTVLSNTFCTFGDIGKIRVGVKTTADKVFIRKDWSGDDRPELLRPLINHKAARRFKALPAESQILYTHQTKGGKRSVVDLEQFPNSKRYLETHRATLEARKYVVDSGRQWFEIWVPQNPALWPAPKLVFPDISEKPTFWMSLDGEIINGDCYWLAASSPEDIDLLWLALAVANSTFIESFYDRAFNNKLYSGRRRFMTQYVEKFPIPDPQTPIAKQIVDSAKRIFTLTPCTEAKRLADELDQQIGIAFGVSKESAR